MIEDPQLHQLFKAESAEHLARLDDGLLRLEKTPSDHALLEEVFREAHSLKGAARMLGLPEVEIAAHELEGSLNTVRKDEKTLTPEALENMTAALEGLRKLVAQALGETIPLPPAETQAAQETASAPPAPAETTLPRKEDYPPEPPATGKIPTGMAGEPFRIETVRVETRKLDDLLTLSGELSVIQGQWQHRMALMDEMLEQWTTLERSRRKSRLSSHTSADSGDETLTLLGTTIRQVRRAFYEDVARLESSATALEERVYSARLLPLSTIFSLFPRMVHELAKEQGKEVELVIEGAELNVDKRVLEEMKDPLMHLLRNAIDHGIEPPAERERRGKPRSSRLLLRAERENDRVLLEVRDDGRGLDMDAIRHMAQKYGLYNEAELAAMSASQLQQMIFLPGFSTSTFVTELSGRGVGLDVVRVNVERLKGDIRLVSEPGRGAAMQMRLPLGLATTRLLLVGTANRRFGLPVEFVHTTRRVRDEELFTLEGRPAFELEGQAIIAPHLADLLDLPAASQVKDMARPGWTACIVLRVGDEQIGLRVDELLDEEEVLTKPLGAPLRRVRNVSGLSILGNGEICTVLNPSDLVRSTHRIAAQPTTNAPAQTQRTGRPLILLAEDAMLVRVMEKRILEDAGYEVVAAIDGKDALAELERHTFAAVVSDIMMPNMDGLALTARIRQNPAWRDLPVILVTSLASDDDKRRGLEAGANAYIPKPSFDQHVLLDTLQRLIVP